MLTTDRLAVLIKYHWNPALFGAQASAAERALLAPVDWEQAAELVQDLRRYHHGLVAPAYARQLLLALRQLCADAETAQTLLGYASTL